MLPRSIRGQLVLTISIVALAVITLEGVQALTQVRRSEEQAASLVQNVAETIVGSVDLILQDQRNVLMRIAGQLQANEPFPVGCTAGLTMLAPYLRLLNDLVVMDAEGRVICSTLDAAAAATLEGQDRPWVEAARTARSFVVSPVTRLSADGPWVIPLAYPLLDREARFVGVVLATMDAGRFNDYVGNLDITEQALVTIAERGERVVARSRDWDAQVGQNLPTTNPGFDPRGEGSEPWSLALDQSGVPRFWAFSSVPGTDWLVFVGLPEAYVHAAGRMALVRGLVVSGLLLALVGGLTALVYTRVNLSLKNLLRGTRAAAEGDPGSIPDTGPEEILEVGAQVRRTLELRQAAEAEVRAAENRLRSILNNAAFGIFLADEEGFIRAGNPALASMAGVSTPEELEGTLFPMLFSDPQEGYEFLSLIQATGSVRGAEFRWRTGPGGDVTVRLTGTRVAIDRDEVQFEIIAEDISAQRDLQIQLIQSQKMEAVGRLAGGVAHDFNNLLTVIQGHAEILSATLDEEARGRRNVGEILQAAERASNLTGQLLSFSRVDGSDQPRTVDLNQLVLGMEAMCNRLIGDDVEMVLDLAPKVRPVRVDPGRIEQVILNLVVNARDAMPDGGRVTIRTSNLPPMSSIHEEDEGWAVMEVVDTGAGITPEVKKRIFEPFFTTKAPGKGTGLGLSTVHGIVTAAGGTIRVFSGVGEGSTFQVLLPGDVRHEDSVQRPSPETPEEPGIQGTVLVVEDEEQVREIVVRVLEIAGFETLEASNGDDGLELGLIHGHELDLIVSDVVMPGIKGPEMVDRIHESHPDVPVVFISGYAQGAFDRGELKKRNAVFVPKPFKPQEIVTRVREVLRKRDDPAGPEAEEPSSAEQKRS